MGMKVETPCTVGGATNRMQHSAHLRCRAGGAADGMRHNGEKMKTVAQKHRTHCSDRPINGWPMRSAHHQAHMAMALALSPRTVPRAGGVL